MVSGPAATRALAADIDPVRFEVIRNALLAITEEPDASTLVHPGWTATVDEHANLVLRPSPADPRDAVGG